MQMRYDLFVPAGLAVGIDRRNIIRMLPRLPLAISMGGQFAAQLNAAADKAGVWLNTLAACSSFTQAARVVGLGEAAAFLPEIAAVEFQDGGVVQLRSSFLEKYVRPLSLAWHPRRRAAIPLLDTVIGALQPRPKTPAVHAKGKAR